MINWIQNWLIDRKQRVVVDWEVSNWKSVLNGISQGSVVGPIVYLIIIIIINLFSLRCRRRNITYIFIRAIIFKRHTVKNKNLIK